MARSATRKLNPRRIAALGMAAALVVLLGALALFVVQLYRSADQELAQIEPRFARLAGLQASRTQLAEAQGQARDALARYAYPASQDATQAGNDAQQRVRAIFAAAKLEVVSSQVLAPKADGGFERVPLSVRVEGELPALQTALMALSAEAPALLVDSMNIQGNGFVRADAGRLIVQFSLSVLRVKP